MLKMCPVLFKVNTQDVFRIYMGGGYGFIQYKRDEQQFHIDKFYNVEILFETSDSVNTFAQYYDSIISMGDNSFAFTLNVKCNMDNISFIQRTYVYLWNIFRKAVLLAFGQHCRANRISPIDDNGEYDNKVCIDEKNADDWKCIPGLTPSIIETRTFLKKALLYYHPEIDDKSANEPVTDFIKRKRHNMKK